MESILLDIVGKIEPTTAAAYETVSKASALLDIPFVVVGASARDLVMQYGYGTTSERATHDLDFGIQVADWEAFYNLKKELEKQAFTTSSVDHRMYSKLGIPIDIVPFGGNQNSQARIAWPPNGERVMNVLGFQEACTHAIQVRIIDNPPLEIPVASPEGMVLLKLVAWTDRDRQIRTKDARDTLFLLKTYENIPTINDALYENSELLNFYDWDTGLAAADKLGSNAAAIALPSTYETIRKLLQKEPTDIYIDRLVDEMCEPSGFQFERNKEIMNSFTRGFTRFR